MTQGHRRNYTTLTDAIRHQIGTPRAITSESANKSVVSVMFHKNKEGTEIFLRNGGEEAQMLIEESKSHHVQTHRHGGKWLIQGNSACTETAAKMNGTKPAPRFA